jgi:hypothetical protein
MKLGARSQDASASQLFVTFICFFKIFLISETLRVRALLAENLQVILKAKYIIGNKFVMNT